MNEREIILFLTLDSAPMYYQCYRMSQQTVHCLKEMDDRAEHT
jgi:hypothetical protein